MLFTRWKLAKNKKGVTLVEMIAAIAITTILAAVLSAMIVPVMNTYRNASAKAELQEAATARLNDIAQYLRGATGVYLTRNLGTDSGGSFPDISIKNSVPTDQYDGVRNYDIHYGFAWCKAYGDGYYYPELKIVDWSNGTDKPTSKYPEDYSDSDAKTAEAKRMYPIYRSMKLDSDVFQRKEISMPNKESFYFYVRKNPDGDNHSNVLEVHLTVKQGKVSYEATKTIVCENLMIQGENIKTCSFNRNQTTGVFSLNDAVVANSTKKAEDWTYYSVWFSKDI